MIFQIFQKNTLQRNKQKIYNKKLTDEQIAFIKENYETKGQKFCIDALDLSKSTISSLA